MEAAAGIEDSETGSSAERFTEQPFRSKDAEEEIANISVQDAEPAGRFLVLCSAVCANVPSQSCVLSLHYWRWPITLPGGSLLPAHRFWAHTALHSFCKVREMPH